MTKVPSPLQHGCNFSDHKGLCRSKPRGRSIRPSATLRSLSANPQRVHKAKPTLFSPRLNARSSPPSQIVALRFGIPAKSFMATDLESETKAVVAKLVLPTLSTAPDHLGGSHMAVEYPYLGMSSCSPLFRGWPH